MRFTVIPNMFSIWFIGVAVNAVILSLTQNSQVLLTIGKLKTF